jgi:hypothetical protein
MAYSTIDKPSKYFNTVLYTGDGASPKSITGVGFKPDFVWSKSRSTAENHNLYDAVRGGTQGLRSNSDAVETSSNIYGYVSTFDSDGVTYISGGTNNDLNNGSGVTFVNWNWLGANTTVSNTSGTITSTVSANTTSGFSIVSYTGNATNGATVGHGLSSAPQMVITKSRDSSGNWQVLTNTYSNYSEGDYMSLNAPDAKANSANVSFLPTSTTWQMKSAQAGNTSGTKIAYCFHSVKGYSKFGSYTGNGSADGTFIYTGFSPAFVMIKETSGSGAWRIYDSKRGQGGDNIGGNYKNALMADVSDVEESGASNNIIDSLSNGFKCRNSFNDTNGSGGLYIYMAFASSPFVSSKAIPTTAR